MGAGELGADARPAQPLDRLAVAALGGVALAEQVVDAGLDPRAHSEDVTCVRSDSHPSAATTSARSPVLDAASASSGTTKGSCATGSRSNTRHAASRAASPLGVFHDARELRKLPLAGCSPGPTLSNLTSRPCGSSARPTCWPSCRSGGATSLPAFAFLPLGR
jgi:hypothetical protein